MSLGLSKSSSHRPGSTPRCTRPARQRRTDARDRCRLLTAYAIVLVPPPTMDLAPSPPDARDRCRLLTAYAIVLVPPPTMDLAPSPPQLGDQLCLSLFATRE